MLAIATQQRWMLQWVSSQKMKRMGDTDCSSSFSEKESNRSDIERESHSSMEEDDNISEATNMDWEEGQPLTSDIDAEADDLNKQEDKFLDQSRVHSRN
ncbi:hypothetical protein OIU85_028927 [Salix viminalis]|uniref:Uncharacterized protein n=1 Tax=Salix viminalis TaxID=40686 RepID=A0A9Q0QAP0_SALVM|nr:hypothetical protein OIU85_028927 [Salix viminalis]